MCFARNARVHHQQAALFIVGATAMRSMRVTYETVPRAPFHLVFFKVP